MAYHIETTRSNGYRCGCCSKLRKDSWWEDSLEEALSELPTEFPTEVDSGGTTHVTIKDGATGKVIAESKVSFAPVWQRGDGYKFTGWSLYIDEDAVPGRGTYINQIIEGRNLVPETYGEEDPPKPDPLRLITDRSWSQLCDELQEARRQKDIREAETALAEATKKLARLTGGTPAPSGE